MTADDTPTTTGATTTPGDGLLNVEIARLLGWQRIPGSNGMWTDPQGVCRGGFPRYSSDPAAALSLLERVLSITHEDDQSTRFECGASKLDSGSMWFWLTDHSEHREFSAEADTLSQAIAKVCRDALVALAAEKEG